MNLYKITQSVNNDYDTYDSAVVVAESEDDARTIHPGDYVDPVTEELTSCYGWARLSAINAKLIGHAAEGTPRGVICASFNAG